MHRIQVREIRQFRMSFLVSSLLDLPPLFSQSVLHFCPWHRSAPWLLGYIATFCLASLDDELRVAFQLFNLEKVGWSRSRVCLARAGR